MLSKANLKGPPPRLILSYVLDWIVIIAIAAVAGGFSYIDGYRRPFSLVDPDISFPYVGKETVSVPVLFVVALIVPAVLIVLISLVLIPGSSASKRLSTSQTWKLKLWEWNAGWMGLALSCATTTMITQGLKSLVGKPRPDLISRCDPDLANASQYVVGGINDRISEGALVSWKICRQTDPSFLKDGFASFPSGHASLAFAGLFYFALYLCSKFAIRSPYLFEHHTSRLDSSTKHNDAYNDSSSSRNIVSIHDDIRQGGAAPPTYLLTLPLIVVSVALYIATTRYPDFRHHGFDIITSSLLGIVIAWLSFRYYHLPITRGAGWAWRSRSAQNAYGIGVGVMGYVDRDHLHQDSNDDPERGLTMNGAAASTSSDGHQAK